MESRLYLVRGAALIAIAALSSALSCADIGEDSTLSRENGASGVMAPSSATIYYAPADYPPSMTATMLSFQGLVNRDAPRLFFVFSQRDRKGAGAPASQPEGWLDVIMSSYPSYTFVPLAHAADALAKPELKALADKLVVYRESDSKLAVNIALTISGIDGAVAVEESHLGELQALGYAIQGNGRGDIRGFLHGKKKNGERYKESDWQRWALEHLRDLCTDDMYGASMGNALGNSLPRGVDYIVQHKMFLFMLAVDPEFAGGLDTSAVQEDILATYKPQTIAYGWWGKETKDIPAISAHGHTFIIDGWNHSLHQHLGAAPITPPAPEPLPAYSKKKAYAAFVVTQSSEAMGYLQGMVHEDLHMPSSHGGLVKDRLPFGIMFAASQPDFQPLVMRT